MSGDSHAQDSPVFAPPLSPIRTATPMTERLVQHLLTTQRAYDDYGLYHINNVTAYRWRTFEVRWPQLARFLALFRFGPRIAYGV